MNLSKIFLKISLVLLMACVFIEGNFQLALGIFAAVCMLVIIFAKPLAKSLLPANKNRKKDRETLMMIIGVIVFISGSFLLRSTVKKTDLNPHFQSYKGLCCKSNVRLMTQPFLVLIRSLLQ